MDEGEVTFINLEMSREHHQPRPVNYSHITSTQHKECEDRGGIRNKNNSVAFTELMPMPDSRLQIDKSRSHLNSFVNKVLNSVVKTGQSPEVAPLVSGK